MTALGTGHISPKNYVLCRNKQRLMIDLSTENNFMKEEREGKPQAEREGTSEKDFNAHIDYYIHPDYHLFFSIVLFATGTLVFQDQAGKQVRNFSNLVNMNTGLLQTQSSQD